MTHTAYRIHRPEFQGSSVVFASPHSGDQYPDWFLQKSILDPMALRSSEDAFVDQLFAAAPDFGAPLLCAKIPRAIVDFNRSAEELDPALIANVRAVGNNARVASGLGVIPRVVSNGRAIYHGKITEAEAKDRLSRYWHPYHSALRDLLSQAQAQFGEAILIDCHSMPREALDILRSKGTPRPEIVLGDRFGASAGSTIVSKIESAFRRAGFVVARNAPFAGAYVTQHYGRPSRRQHAVQIEIDRAIYMDEERLTPRPDFAQIQSALREAIAEIVDIGQPVQNLAAE